MSIKEVKRDIIDEEDDLLYIQCDCSHPVAHSIVMQRSSFDYGRGAENEFYIYANANQYCGFFRRLKLAFLYLFNRQVIMHTETIVRNKQMKEVIKWLQEMVDKE